MDADGAIAGNEPMDGGTAAKETVGLSFGCVEPAVPTAARGSGSAEGATAGKEEKEDIAGAGAGRVAVGSRLG